MIIARCRRSGRMSTRTSLSCGTGPRYDWSTLRMMERYDWMRDTQDSTNWTILYSLCNWSISLSTLEKYDKVTDEVRPLARRTTGEFHWTFLASLGRHRPAMGRPPASNGPGASYTSSTTRCTPSTTPTSLATATSTCYKSPTATSPPPKSARTSESGPR